MNTYDVSTETLLKKHGHLICAKTGVSYQNIYNAGPGSKLRSNWLYFEVRKPLVKIDGGEVKRTSKTPVAKILCEHLSRDAWMKLWDDAHTNPYEKVVKDYQERCLNEMNAV